MQSLEKRIAELEKTAGATLSPSIIIHFVCPIRRTVSIRNMTTGQEIERLDDESEAQFLARAELMNNTVEAQHGES